MFATSEHVKLTSLQIFFSSAVYCNTIAMIISSLQTIILTAKYINKYTNIHTDNSVDR